MPLVRMVFANAAELCAWRCRGAYMAFSSCALRGIFVVCTAWHFRRIPRAPCTRRAHLVLDKEHAGSRYAAIGQHFRGQLNTEVFRDFTLHFAMQPFFVVGNVFFRRV